MNQTYKILTFVLLVVIIILSIVLVFSRTGNRALKKENKDLRSQIKDDRKVIEDLKIDLEKWNEKIKLNVDEEDINDISNDFDSRAKFLSKFLYGEKDSLGK